MDAPKIRQVTVHFGGEGKVALQGFGKESSGYGINISRTYDVPNHWDNDQLELFELETFSKVQAQVEALIQHEHDSRLRVQEDRIVNGEFDV